jgi:hypothetical protein
MSHHITSIWINGGGKREREREIYSPWHWILAPVSRLNGQEEFITFLTALQTE